MAENTLSFIEKIVNAILKKNFGSENILRVKPAVVIGCDEKTGKTSVYMLDDNTKKPYNLLNKTGEILVEGDNVKVYYTKNIAKGYIGMRVGLANVVKASGVGRASGFDDTSEYFNSYEGSNKNIAGVAGKKSFATAKGHNTKSTGFASFACGQNNTASGDHSFATGYATEVTGINSFVCGQESKVYGANCFASGQGNTLSSNAYCSTTMGYFNNIEGSFCHAQNAYNTVSGYYNSAEGQSNKINGGYSNHCGGQSNEITACDFSYIFGLTNKMNYCSNSGIIGRDNSNIEQTNTSFVVGSSNTVRNISNGIVSGMNNEVLNTQSFLVNGMFNKVDGGSGNGIFGRSNVLNGSSENLVSGNTNELNGSTSCLVNGSGLKIEGAYCVAAFGQYNNPLADYVFMVGNGTGDNSRSNAFAVTRGGVVICKSVAQLGADGTMVELHDTHLDLSAVSLEKNFTWNADSYPNSTDPDLNGKPVLVLSLVGGENVTYKFIDMSMFVYDKQDTQTAETVLSDNKFAVNVKISAEDNNVLVKRDDGLYASIPDITASNESGNIIQKKEDGFFAANRKIKLINHEPTSADLEGEECIIMQYDSADDIVGANTTLHKITGLFYEN